MMVVEKRDGTIEQFDYTKIENAIFKAACRIYPDLEKVDISNMVNKIVDKIDRKYGDKGVCSVPEIVTIIEDILMASKYKDVARLYIEYRSERDRIREGNSPLIVNVKGLIENTNKDITNENANKDAKVVSTHRDLLAGIVSKHITMKQLLPKKIVTAHEEGYIHFHDADYYLSAPLTNCCLVNYIDMLANGFKIGNANIETPQSIGVATTILTQIILAVSSSQYGGQTIAHIDSGLVPYVKKTHDKLLKQQKEFNWSDTCVDALLEKEVYDAMQTFLYQTNSITSSNGQTPFITISLGLDTSRYGRMVTRAYLQNHLKGLGKDGMTPVFPKVIFFLEDGVNLNEGDVNYDLKQLALETCAKRIYPDFISVPNNRAITGSTAEPVTSMGCRSFLSKWVNPKTGKEQYNGRFNLGVVSVNLPMLAIEADGSKEKFFELVDTYMDICYDAHMERVNRIKDCKAKQNPIMFTEGVLARLKPEERIGKLFYDGYASISMGYIGIAETCQILDGKLNKELGLEILQYMKKRCEIYKNESRLAFSLYGTPKLQLGL